ncbi:mitochondrial Homoaconitase [Coemansia sp. RSA 1365]|nr:mitochondrial Homoaconitase [Coemansia sp. RSA 1365]
MSFRLLVAAAAARRMGATAARRHPALASTRGFSFTAVRRGGQTLVEKIAQRHAVGIRDGELVRSGDFVAIRPRHVMTHDNTGAVIPKFRSIGATRLADPHQPVFALDHDIQNKGDKNLKKYHDIEQFAQDHGNRFYPAGRGIAHQVLVEEGHAWPGTMVVGSDSHSNMYGGVGCLGTPVVRTDAAAIWATSQTWWQAPPVARVELRGRLPPGVVGKDVIVALCALFSHDEVLNHAVEFVGEGARALVVEDRLAIANMTTEWGALAGIFAVDDTTLRWYEARARRPAAAVNEEAVAALRASIKAEPAYWAADFDAVYAKRLWLDLSSLVPHVSGPDTVKVATPLPALEAQKVAIQKAYIVSCVNSRAKDLREAADVIRAAQRARPSTPVKAAAGVSWYVAAASSQVMADAQTSGDWQVLVDAGAKTLPPGCGPCIGLGVGLLEDGEVGISATNRNYKGRMGSKMAHTYLASPAVVAASAIRGHICSPATAVQGAVDAAAVDSAGGVLFGIESPGTSSCGDVAGSASPDDAIHGFPVSLTGRLVFLPADNLNTDGIYPGKYTYQDDITREQMRLIVMENYDPEFSRVIQNDDIVVAGANFGTGSSREQAATALLAAGVRLVVCESASETFKRNAVNNGLLVLESPPLVQWLRARYDASNAALTIVSGLEAHVNLVAGQIQLKDDGGKLLFEGSLPRIGKAAQEIIVAGGLENWVRRRMSNFAQ